MKYTLNTTILGNTFVVPSIVADKFLKIATVSQIKVLLYFMRNLSDGIDPSKIAEALSLPESEVEDALFFWSQNSVLNSEQPPKQTEKKPVIVTAELPSRADVIKRGLEDENLMFLLQEAQMLFGRNLKQNESQLLVSLYDDHGMSVSVILLLLGYAVKEGKCNLSFVKKTATDWLTKGVETVLDAEKILTKSATQNLAWKTVCAAFGLESRKPSDKELELCDLWVNEWKYTPDLLKAAYNVCVDTKSKFRMAYVAKILENWHKQGVKTLADVESNKEKSTGTANLKQNNYAGYDLNKYEQMLRNKVNGGEHNDT